MADVIVRSMRLTAGAVVAALVLSLLPIQPHPANAATDTAGEHALLCLVNAERTARGLTTLRHAPDLTDVARRHSARMASQSHLHHNPNLASEVTGWRLIAENVGRGPSIDSVHRALMASSGHRANILNTRVKEIGIGVDIRAGQVWVTQIFRDPSGSARGTTPSCRTVAEQPGTISIPAGVVPVTGDWNGDRRATPGGFKDGMWYLSNGMSPGADLAFRFGQPGDLPVVGDWNGDGRDGIGVIRGNAWLLRDSRNAGPPNYQFLYGRADLGDLPIAGDWDGDGRDTIGIIRGGQWHLRHSLSGGPGQTVFTYGRITSGDVPLIGDWNGDGRDRIGIVRRGEWHLRHSLSGGPGQTVFTYGRVLRGDVPLIGDWNRSGTSGVGIVRGTEWHLRNTLSGGNAQILVDYR